MHYLVFAIVLEIEREKKNTQNYAIIQFEPVIDYWVVLRNSELSGAASIQKRICRW